MRRMSMNNIKLEKDRAGTVYQTIIVDLIKGGVIDQAKGEALLGYSIPSNWNESSYAGQLRKKVEPPAAPTNGGE